MGGASTPGYPSLSDSGKGGFLWRGRTLPPSAYVTGFLPPTGGCPSLSCDVREGTTCILHRGPTQPGGPQAQSEEVEVLLTGLVFIHLLSPSPGPASRMF